MLVAIIEQGTQRAPFGENLEFKEAKARWSVREPRLDAKNDALDSIT